MAFGNSAALQADVEFRANTRGFAGDMAQIRQAAERTFGALDSTTLKAALASEKYDRAIARSKGSTFAVAKATAAYKSEMASLAAAEGRATSGAHRHSGALQAEERSLGRAARGALVGSGALGHLGRAAIFASSSLLGGYGLVYSLRTLIKAAQEEQVALGQLQVSLTDSGLAWGHYGRQIEEALNAQVRTTAFNRGELTASLAGFVRRYGDVNEALRANAIAADVARARNIDLATAQTLVQRATFGNPRSLRALGIEAVKVTTSYDQLKATTAHATAEAIANAKAADAQATSLAALDAINRKYHGNAAKFLTTSAGKEALFNAELRQSEAIIGQDILPTFNHFLTTLSDWLSQSENQKRLQRDLNEVLRDSGHVIHGVELVVKPLVGDFKLLGKAVGGNRHEFELLGVAIALFAIKSKLLKRAAVASDIEAIGTSAVTARGRVAGLRGSLLGLRSLGPIVIPLVILEIVKKGGLKGFGEEISSPLKGLPGALGRFFDPRYDDRGHLIVQRYTQPSGPPAPYPFPFRPPKKKPAGSGGAGGGSGGGGGSVTVGLSYSQQNALLIAQATKTTADDLRVLNRDLGILNAQLQQKGLTAQERNEILSERNDVLSQIDAITSANVAAAKGRRDKAILARKHAQDVAQRSRQKRIDRLTRVPVELAIEEANARAHGASAKRLVHILEEEKRALEQQVALLKKIGASRDDILKARETEARVQAKIDALLKKKTAGAGAQEQGFIDSLSGVLGQFASDVGITSGGAGGAKVIHVHQDNRGRDLDQWAAARAAREAAKHLL